MTAEEQIAEQLKKVYAGIMAFGSDFSAGAGILIMLPTNDLVKFLEIKMLEDKLSIANRHFLDAAAKAKEISDAACSLSMLVEHELDKRRAAERDARKGGDSNG